MSSFGNEEHSNPYFSHQVNEEDILPNSPSSSPQLWRWAQSWWASFDTLMLEDTTRASSQSQDPSPSCGSRLLEWVVSFWATPNTQNLEPGGAFLNSSEAPCYYVEEGGTNVAGGYGFQPEKALLRPCVFPRREEEAMSQGVPVNPPPSLSTLLLAVALAGGTFAFIPELFKDSLI